MHKIIGLNSFKYTLWLTLACCCYLNVNRMIFYKINFMMGISVLMEYYLIYVRVDLCVLRIFFG